MRRINVVDDTPPEVKKPEAEEKFQRYSKQADSRDEVDFNIIEERESEIDEIIKEFIFSLADVQTPDERDIALYGFKDEIESLKDEIEEVLAEHGIFIYRPTIIENTEGDEVVVNSYYEEF